MLNKTNQDLFPREFYDILKVLEMGAIKHGRFNWLEPGGSKSSHKDMHASMFRHLAESSAKSGVDHESGFSPLLHLACRALMMYTRQQRGLDHSDDTLEEFIGEGEEIPANPGPRVYAKRKTRYKDKYERVGFDTRPCGQDAFGLIVVMLERIHKLLEDQEERHHEKD